MRNGAGRVFGTIIGAVALVGLAPAPAPIFGFSPLTAAAERVDEARFLDLPSAHGAFAEAETIGARPHYAGTPADQRLAQAARDRLIEYGFDAHIESFTARVDTPRKLALELLADGRPFIPRDALHKARGVPPIGLDLREFGTAADPATLAPAVGLPFIAGSGDGDLIAPLVYAHRGLPEDFATLRGAGIDVRNAVVLIRYGAAFRGTLARNAQAAGAAGVLFYNDPADDGYAKGAPYPYGPWRPTSSVQRGSVGPGIRIPVIPISADNAQLLLRTLHGTPGPADWRGALDAPYPIGKGPAAVHLIVTMNHETRTLWNTIGIVHGSLPQQSVLLGAHRDAWVYGVDDNGAGTTSLLETARGLGYLARSGWHPKRSVIVALWDGEELGLLGSAAFVHQHAEALQRGCIAYLNADENLTGTQFAASAVGALAPAIIDATRAVTDPARERTTLYDRWSLQARGIAIEEPGGGSDHQPFLAAFGTPVAAMNFAGPFGPYHSSYDTLRYAYTFSDPGFVLHRTSAQLYGVVAMRLANADVLPYSFASFVPVLRAGVMSLRVRAQHDARAIDSAALLAAIDRFATASRIADGRLRRGDGPPADRALAVVQSIDRITYGMSGYRTVVFPKIASAYENRDDAALAATIIDTATTIDRAADNLR